MGLEICSLGIIPQESYCFTEVKDISYSVVRLFH